MTGQPLATIEARAIYQLMTGQRIVRLDPACPDPVEATAAVVRTLLELQPPHLMAVSDIRVASTQDRVRNQIARRLADRLADGDASIAQVWNGDRALGRMSRDGFRMVLVGTIETGDSLTNLLVTGFENHPWRWVPKRSAPPERRWAHAARGNQLLIVGAERPWEAGFFDNLLAPAHDRARIPWGDRIPVEVLVAGAD